MVGVSPVGLLVMIYVNQQSLLDKLKFKGFYSLADEPSDKTFF
jgi:hypothetical protein